MDYLALHSQSVYINTHSHSLSHQKYWLSIKITRQANGIPYTCKALLLIWEINSCQLLMFSVRRRFPCIALLFHVHSNLHQKLNASLLLTVSWVCHSIGPVSLWFPKHLYQQFSNLVYSRITRGSVKKKNIELWLYPRLVQ